MLVLAGIFIFCWTPYAVLSLAGICGLAEVGAGLQFISKYCIMLRLVPSTICIIKLLFPGNSSFCDSISTADGQEFHPVESGYICHHEPYGKLFICLFKLRLGASIDRPVGPSVPH